MNFGIESEIVEFKESTGEKHEALESIAAIINKHGYGTLYFGVKDNGDAKGQIITDSTIKDLTDSIFRDIEPRIIPTIEHLDIGDKSILKVTFSGTQVPYSAFGKLLIRVGTQNRKMSRDELIRLVKEFNYSLDWEDKCNHEISEINDEDLLHFYEEAVGCGRLSMNKYDKYALLSTLGLCKHDKVLNAGYALFGRNGPISLKVASFATDEKITFIDLKEIRGNIYCLITEAVDYISKNIHWRAEIGKQRRIEIPEIPVMAIREMIINAFAHANYQSDPQIEVNIHPGKITIFNPGAFPDNLTPNDFIEKDISSIKRNPLILSVLFRCKNVEQSGTGFKRMNQMCKENNIAWDYCNSAYGFYFIFLRNNVQANIQATNGKNDLSDNERIIYEKLKTNNKIQKFELSIAINKSEKTVQRVLVSLIQKGFVKRIGNNQYGYWEIIK